MKAQTKNRDPFSRIPIPKSFYHPSQQKNLTKTQRKIALSPSKESRVNPEDEAFLKGTNIYSSQTPPTREHDFGPSKFDESWPSSERPSIASTSGYDRCDNLSMVSDVKHSLFTPLATEEDNFKTGSVLQRYVNRFRNSAPMSREERVQKGVGDDKDFWWLGKTSEPTLTPANSSTPKDEEGQRSRQFIDRSESQAYKETFQSLSSARKRRTQLEDDLATQNLQDKADRILSQSESSLGSLEAGPAVSSDGLGSCESQSSSFNEPTITPRPQYRTEFKDKRDKDIPGKSRTEKEDIRLYKSGIKHPEDDILYQWRLQRKMDLSRNGVAKLISKNNSEVQSKLKEIQQRVLIKDMSETGSRPQLSTPRFTSAPTREDDDIYRNAEIPSHSNPEEPEKLPKQTSQKPYIASPTLSRKEKRDKENVEPHLHLMCDVLPCPHAQKYQEQFKSLYSDSLPNWGGAENKGVSKTQHSEHTSSKIVSDSWLDEKTDLFENKQYKEAEKPERDSKTHSDSAIRISKSAQTRDKSSTESLNKVTSPELEADKQSASVLKSTESVLESVDFESSDIDLTYRENETLKDEELSHSNHPGSPKRIPKSPTKSKVIHPKYSSSPARSAPPINSAIGQTVKDYMFTPSSSVDSMTSLLSNIAESSPDRQQTPSSGRRQEQTSSRERSESSRDSTRLQTQSSNSQGEPSGREKSKQTLNSTKEQQADGKETSKKHQTSSSRQQKESSRRPKSPTSNQHRGQSSQLSSGNRGSSRRPETERDSTESLARSSQEHSTLSSRDLEAVDGEVQDEHTRYSSQIDDDDISDEEFADDQLLKLLRQQRNDIEKKLGEIDRKLLER